MRILLLVLTVFCSIVLLSACAFFDKPADNSASIVTTKEEVATEKTPLPNKYYGDGTEGSSWWFDPISPCKGEPRMDENGTIYLAYSDGCVVESVGGGLRIKPIKPKGR